MFRSCAWKDCKSYRGHSRCYDKFVHGSLSNPLRTCFRKALDHYQKGEELEACKAKEAAKQKQDEIRASSKKCVHNCGSNFNKCRESAGKSTTKLAACGKGSKTCRASCKKAHDKARKTAIAAAKKT